MFTMSQSYRASRVAELRRQKPAGRFGCTREFTAQRIAYLCGEPCCQSAREFEDYLFATLYPAGVR